MSKFLDTFEKYLRIYLLISIIVLSGVVVFLYKKVESVSSVLSGVTVEKSKDGTKENVLVQRVDVCGDDCKAEIAKSISQAIATLSGTKTTPKTTPTVTTTTPTQTAYIPLSGPLTTTSTDWVDAPGTDVYIDLENDYSKSAKVSWEASLKVAHGNGTAYARLFDVTHKIAVSGSEVSTTNNTNYSTVSSANLNLWSGRNLYRVQIKSLNSFEVTFGSGRIKITY